MENTSVSTAFKRIENLVNLEKTIKGFIRVYRLDRMKKLLSIFGNPENSFRVIHLAGSKGKGTTASYTAAILENLGFSCGLYMSPHVYSYRERITLGGVFFPDEVYIDTIDFIFRKLDQYGPADFPGGQLPTTFEVLTLLALLIFKNRKCEWAVLETGIGGRLDATNAVMPDTCVITPIEIEHTEYLGNTLSEIAGEKAGIIKPGVPIVTAPQDPEAMEQFIRISEDKGSPLVSMEPVLSNLTISSSRGRYSISGEYAMSDIRLNFDKAPVGLSGLHNCQNALTALTAVLLCGTKIPDKRIAEAAEQAWKEVKIPGRLELVHSGPPVVVDGSHTGKSVRAASSVFTEQFGPGGIILFGAVEGKDIPGMLTVLREYFNCIIITRPGTFKNSDPEGIFRLAEQQFPQAFLEISAEGALSRGMELSQGQKPILCIGSFYLPEQIRSCIQDKRP